MVGRCGFTQDHSTSPHHSSHVAQLFSLGITRMKQQINRPIVTKGSPVVPIFAALTMLGLSIYAFPFLLDEIKSGWAYSPAVVFGDGTKVYHNTSPAAYWVSVAIPMVGFVAMPILSIFVLCGVVIDHKRKVAAAAKEKAQRDA